MALFPEIGDLFEGRYRVEAPIGSGGFARVYRAQQEDLGRTVALKILTPGGEVETGTSTYSEKVAERFAQEAKLVSRLRDAHTITMYDYGRTDGGVLYMVFEFIDGDSLADILENEGALPADRVMKIVEQTLMSLQEAHSLGVMHRDVKPANIMVFEHVGRRDQVKVLDFGIAKMARSSDMSGSSPRDLTADGALVGTPRYMSPEQIRGEELNGQSDLYSLGLVAYELLVGEKAIASNSSVTIIGKQLDPRPFYLPGDTGIPYGARYVVDRLLAKDRDARYASAAAALEDVARWHDIEPGADVSGTDPTLAGTPEERARGIQVTPMPERRSDRLVARVPDEGTEDFFADAPTARGAAIGGMALLVIAAVALTAGAFAISSGDPDPPRVPEPAPQLTEMRIVTEPTGLEIEVNGRAVGQSPVLMKTGEVNFPAIIAARLDAANERKVEVLAPAPSVTVDFTDVINQRAALEQAKAPAPALDEPATEPVTPEPAVQPKPKPRRKPALVAEEPVPSPKPKPKPKPKEPPLPTFVPMDKHE